GIVIAAGMEGKQKAAFQVAGITFLLLHYGYPVDFGLFAIEFDANKVGTILLFVSLFFSIWSMVDYFRGFVRAVYQPPGA
ncbi:MAG: CDP-diacylglycerol--glycerol-3-phosphate 3-phosphatidyltransferase, partial [Anaeromyxobacteraceae bacterium]|nr:CDP-diacylglycerol--glycerol-3-phosphate 3-phosphatidyltransferase [Anaeromyxobacteraceae bacterium]